MQIDLKTIVTKLIPTFKEAAELSVNLQKEGLKITIKDDNSPVTNGDIAVNDLITKKILELTPNIPIISEETASRLSIIFHHWFPNYLTLTFCATFGLDTTSRCDRSCQNNNGQYQSFFLAPVNTTAHLSSFVFGIIPSLPLSTALLEPQMHAVRSPQDLRAFYDQLRLQL